MPDEALSSIGQRRMRTSAASPVQPIISTLASLSLQGSAATTKHSPVVVMTGLFVRMEVPNMFSAEAGSQSWVAHLF